MGFVSRYSSAANGQARAVGIAGLERAPAGDLDPQGKVVVVERHRAEREARLGSARGRTGAGPRWRPPTPLPVSLRPNIFQAGTGPSRTRASFGSPLTHTAAKTQGSLKMSGWWRKRDVREGARALEADHPRPHAAERERDALQGLALVGAVVRSAGAAGPEPPRPPRSPGLPGSRPRRACPRWRPTRPGTRGDGATGASGSSSSSSSLRSLLLLRRPGPGHGGPSRVHVRPRVEARAEHDPLLHLLPREDPQGHVDGLRTARGVLEGGVEDTLPDVAQAPRAPARRSRRSASPSRARPPAPRARRRGRRGRCARRRGRSSGTARAPTPSRGARWARATACRPRTRPRAPGSLPRPGPRGTPCAGPGPGSRS